MADHVHVSAARWYLRRADAASRDLAVAMKGFVLLHWLGLGGAGAAVGLVVGLVGAGDERHAAGSGLVVGMGVGLFVAYGVAITRRILRNKRFGPGRR